MANVRWLQMISSWEGTDEALRFEVIEEGVGGAEGRDEIEAVVLAS